MEEFALQFFKEKVFWNYHPLDAKVTRRVEETYHKLAEQLESLKGVPIPSVLTAKTLNTFGESAMGFVADENADQSKKRQSEFPESEPKRIATESPAPEEEKEEAEEEEPAFVPDAAEPVHPEVPVVKTEIPDPVPESSSSSSPSKESDDLPKLSRSASESNNEEIPPAKEDAEPTVPIPTPEPDAKIDYLQLLERYSHIFCDEFSIPIVTDEVPTEEAYEPDIIELRQPEIVRERREPVRYNDADFEDEEENEDGTKKKKTGKNAKSLTAVQSLAKQLNMTKGRFILDDVTDPNSVRVSGEPTPIKLFDGLINKALQNIKANLAVAMKFVNRGKYDYNRLAKSPEGIMFISYIRNSLRNCISLKAGRSFTRHKNYTMINSLGEQILEEMKKAIEIFPCYGKLQPTPEVTQDQLPRNSLELVLLYHKMYLKYETGFEDKSIYRVEFSNLRDYTSKEAFSRVFNITYQQMVQMRALYYLVNPLNLIDNVCKSFTARFLDRDPKLVASLPQQKSADLEKLFAFIATEDTVNALLTEFVYILTNFEAYFDGTCVKALLSPYDVVNTKTSVGKTIILTPKNTQVKLN